MRKEKKERTGSFCPLIPSIMIAKRRHFSIVFNQKGDSLKDVDQIIDELLMKTFHEEHRKENFTHYINHLMGQFEALENSFFGLDRRSDPPEIYNRCDSQPEADTTKSLKVVPHGHIKKIIRVPAGSLQINSSELHETQQELLQNQQMRKQKESLIHKLKRQHSQTIKTKYLSQSLPIIDKNLQICTEDDHMVQLMRRNIAKQMLPKKSSKKIKIWQDERPQGRKQNKMVTVFKKSKAFIDRIDPTNSMYNTTVVSKDENSIQRKSVYVDSRMLSMQDSILARVTNLSEVTNLVEPIKEKVVERKVSKQGIRFPRLSSDRQEIKNRIEHVSLHTSGKTTLKQISKTSERVRPQNSKSVAELPKIKGI